MEDFVGTWDIQEIEDFEQADLHAMGVPFIKIDKYGSGRFEFSYIVGIFDGRLKTRGGKRIAFNGKGLMETIMMEELVKYDYVIKIPLKEN